MQPEFRKQFELTDRELDEADQLTSQALPRSSMIFLATIAGLAMVLGSFLYTAPPVVRITMLVFAVIIFGILIRPWRRGVKARADRDAMTPEQRVIDLTISERGVEVEQGGEREWFGWPRFKVILSTSNLSILLTRTAVRVVVPNRLCSSWYELAALKMYLATKIYKKPFQTPKCRSCSYPLDGLGGKGECPECGDEFDFGAAGALLPTTDPAKVRQ